MVCYGDFMNTETTSTCDFTLMTDTPSMSRMDNDDESTFGKDVRYHIQESSYVSNKNIQVASWLTWDIAKPLSQRLRDAYMKLHPEEEGKMGSTGFCCILQSPVAVRDGKAEPGDLVLHEIVEPFQTKCLDGLNNFRKFLRISLVTHLNHLGKIERFTDRYGEHSYLSRNYWVISGGQIDTQAVMSWLDKRYADNDHWGIEFSLSVAQNLLSPFLIKHAPQISERAQKLLLTDHDKPKYSVPETETNKTSFTHTERILTHEKDKAFA